jgi:hypothetical protein
MSLPTRDSLSINQSTSVGLWTMGKFPSSRTADQRGGALQRFECHISLVGIEDAVDLGAAGVHQLRSRSPLPMGEVAPSDGAGVGPHSARVIARDSGRLIPELWHRLQPVSSSDRQTHRLKPVPPGRIHPNRRIPQSREDALSKVPLQVTRRAS